MSKAAYNTIIKWELIYTGNNIVGKAKNLQVFIGCHYFLTDFIILENVNEFVEKGQTKVIFCKPFKEKVRLEEDISKGIIWFKIRDDKTLFNMPRAERRLSELTTKQQNLVSPILKISDEDKAKGISHPYQKIKEFYKGCLNMGKEYKQDLEVIEWIKRGQARSVYKESRIQYLLDSFSYGIKVLSGRNHNGYAGNVGSQSTDIAKISRKRSKPDNHGHENGKENTRAGRMLSK
ncbi:hypothetical protein Tco_1225486, partial [Tanacetum coccineum]